MRVLRWSPNVEELFEETETNDKGVQCSAQGAKQWYKKTISIPLWMISATLVGAVSTITIMQQRKRN
jgi:hypothetical protein